MNELIKNYFMGINSSNMFIDKNSFNEKNILGHFINEFKNYLIESNNSLLNYPIKNEEEFKTILGVIYYGIILSTIDSEITKKNFMSLVRKGYSDKLDLSVFINYIDNYYGLNHGFELYSIYPFLHFILKNKNIENFIENKKLEKTVAGFFSKKTDLNTLKLIKETITEKTMINLYRNFNRPTFLKQKNIAFKNDILFLFFLYFYSIREKNDHLFSI